MSLTCNGNFIKRYPLTPLGDASLAGSIEAADIGVGDGRPEGRTAAHVEGTVSVCQAPGYGELGTNLTAPGNCAKKQGKEATQRSR